MDGLYFCVFLLEKGYNLKKGSIIGWLISLACNLIFFVLFLNQNPMSLYRTRISLDKSQDSRNPEVMLKNLKDRLLPFRLCFSSKKKQQRKKLLHLHLVAHLLYVHGNGPQ